MRIELASDPAAPPAPNEDYAAVALPASGAGGAVVVLDGVTPPRDGDTGCVHGVPWFAARLGGAFLELAGTRETPLADCLAAAIRRTAAAHGPACDLTHRRTPQATVAAARWDSGTVEHLVLCDAALLLEGPDGAVRPVLDLRLSQLPRGRPAEEMRNVEGGFFTAAADPEVAARAVVGSVPRTEVTALAALTDGVTRWTEVFGFGDWTALLQRVRKAGPQGVVAEVRAAEAADADRSRYRRGKVHDDASAVLVEL
ncbi:protein phosphatase 2C domain-containing protein [Streptomyces sp. NBC_01808]|uniref:protein phosphatase 2C domain-containing protein n=1 Tax=Streptomyces sp. NBC_01808 TaxID=2975947 RepID=UPI002DDAF6CE|nr:protein phosphatase 2C domain-containing protein [Streptomyces sp. NBC_01808]WSA40568.1 protein phosphatase 2C domain-containing protein [Streptomyces sp. NBC_01808]